MKFAVWVTCEVKVSSVETKSDAQFEDASKGKVAKTKCSAETVHCNLHVGYMVFPSLDTSQMVC